MNCCGCQQLLQAYLDGADSVDPPGLEQHVRQCHACAASFDAAVRLTDGLRLLTRPQPPADLTDRIVGSVLADRRRLARNRARRWQWTALAAAACLLVALGLRTYWPRPAPQGVEVAVKLPGRPAEPPAPPPLRDSVTEAGSAVASLTSRTAGATFGETAALLPLVAGPALPPLGDEVQPMVEPPTRPFRAAGAGVSAGLEPVADSARRALGLFLRDLPPMGAETKEPQEKPS